MSYVANKEQKPDANVKQSKSLPYTGVFSDTSKIEAAHTYTLKATSDNGEVQRVKKENLKKGILEFANSNKDLTKEDRKFFEMNEEIIYSVVKLLTNCQKIIVTKYFEKNELFDPQRRERSIN